MQRVKAKRLFDSAADHVLALTLIFLVLLALHFALFSNVFVAGAPYPGLNAADSGRQLPEDCVAWLSIDNSRINLPVLQGGDVGSSPGSALLDRRNASDFSDDYSLIYEQGAPGVFQPGALDRFRDASYFEQHRRGMLTVGDTAYLLQIFAVLETDAGDDAFFQPGEGEPDPEAVKDAALFYREPNGKRLLALTAGMEGDSDGRIVVLCAISEPLHRVQRLSFYEHETYHPTANT